LSVNKIICPEFKLLAHEKRYLRIGSKYDKLVKSLKTPYSVIPVKTGIQFFQVVTCSLDSGFRRNGDFLQDHQVYSKKILHTKNVDRNFLGCTNKPTLFLGANNYYYTFRLNKIGFNIKSIIYIKILQKYSFYL